MLSDLRLDIDDILAALPGRTARIINLDPDGTFLDQPSPSQSLRRRDAFIEVSAMTLDEIIAEIASGVPDNGVRYEPVLVTNLEEHHVASLVAAADSGTMTLGLHDDAGGWLLIGASPGGEVSAW